MGAIAILVVWFVASIFIGATASRNGRNGIVWFFISFLTSPILAIVLMIAFPRIRYLDR